MIVGLVYTSATEDLLREAPELALNLSDAPETIEAVTQALEAGGHTVVPLNTDRGFPARIAEAQIDMAFNIATGVYGESRQANVPAMLEYLRIPYTGGSVLAESVTHHKPVMKRVLMALGLPTPAFQVFHEVDEPLDAGLRFPLIVKLPAEGGSLGMNHKSVVENEADLRAQVAFLLETYGQGALAEEYVGGREFTVTVLGNRPPYLLPVVERLYFGDIRIQLDEPEPTTLEEYRRLTGKDMAYTVVDSQSVAPAALSDAEAGEIERIALAAYQALACRDWARLDLRMDQNGRLYLLDMNLEPAIAPDYAVARAARAAGWSYAALVNRILDHAVERYPHLRAELTERTP